MSALAGQWLIETFLYTGALIALVLVLRRPVARYFGPGIAYALWALPGLRFIMPPILLPASMAPAEEAAQIAAAGVPAGAGMMAGVMEFAGPVWLLGAAVFLAWRACGYVRMRRSILAGARGAGESGNVRLVETAGVTAPVAFGIVDKVIAVPPGFMAQDQRMTQDRRAARDLAIAHELAHHRGHDLLINILAQPVLALHWFNPLAWQGWRALRKDQEAACDARVMAGRERAERVAYAHVIAGFAAGDRLGNGLALAAPMACPVLGEKSIIHRLRSLSMGEVSQPRRRLGITMLAAGALAVPATASVGYMERDVRAAPPLAAASQNRAVPPSPAITPPEANKEPQTIAPPSTPIPLAPSIAEVMKPAVPPPASANRPIVQGPPAKAQTETIEIAYAPQSHARFEVHCAGRGGVVLCEETQMTQVLVNVQAADTPPRFIRANAIQIRRYTLAPPADAAEATEQQRPGKTV